MPEIYMLSAVGFDYSDSRLLFCCLFAVILGIDMLWVTSPLLLFHKIGRLSLLSRPASPFCSLLSARCCDLRARPGATTPWPSVNLPGAAPVTH